MTPINYQQLPSRRSLLKGLLASVMRAQPTQPQLPQGIWQLPDLLPDARWVARYHQLFDWRAADVLHPALPQVLSFPLQLDMLLDKHMPFKALGLVHIANRIQQYQPVQYQPMSFDCRFCELQKTAKGWQFCVRIQMQQRGQKVWQAKVYLLRRLAQKSAGTASGKLDLQAAHVVTDWNLSSRLGRQYAAVSSDFNPIHLHPLSAKLFGFGGHIAHGMWAKAACISALPLPVAFSVETEFKQPIYLPRQISLLTQDNAFYLSSEQRQRLHLVGQLAGF